jgi:ribosomal-protein-alanine N-acetyltransferase
LVRRRPIGADVDDHLRADGADGPVIETERLWLRPLALSDAREFGRLFAGDWEAVKQTGRIPYPPEPGPVRDWIRLHEGPHSHGFAVLLKETGAFLGLVGYGGDAFTAEVGYAFGRTYWGRGYATEAVIAMSGHARATGLSWIEAFSFVENPASARVLEKSGFGELGTITRAYPERGGRRRVRQFRLRLKDDAP